MGIAVIFSRPVVPVLGDRIMRSKSLQQFIIILMEFGIICINKDGGCYVHGLDQYQAFLNPAFLGILPHDP
jgi:hypothetical protein